MTAKARNLSKTREVSRGYSRFSSASACRVLACSFTRLSVAGSEKKEVLPRLFPARFRSSSTTESLKEANCVPPHLGAATMRYLIRSFTNISLSHAFKAPLVCVAFLIAFFPKREQKRDCSQSNRDRQRGKGRILQRRLFAFMWTKTC